jgi:BirA family biotin operon repressor/biotin-[acetyl-CoA-carboxylase] ligase
MDALDAQAIAAQLGAHAARANVEVCASCASTNAELLRRAPAEGRALILAAEEQTAGRGRRGRRWLSSPGAAATFSVSRRLHCAPAALAGLSLAAGVAAVRALRGLGIIEALLKWPNDLLLRGAKIGGILVETRQLGSEICVVIGIGINCRSTPGLGRRLRRRVAALDDSAQPPLARNAVIGAVAREVLDALQEFERAGFAAFAADWTALHAYEGRRLRVRLEDGRTLSGVASGLAANGALRLRTRSGLREVATGQVVTARAQ